MKKAEIYMGKKKIKVFNYKMFSLAIMSIFTIVAVDLFDKSLYASLIVLIMGFISTRLLLESMEIANAKN